MCYLIELKDKYLIKEYITLTVEKKEGININNVKWTMTSDHDFLGVFNSRLGKDVMPFKFTSYFRGKMNQRITTVQSIRNPLKCKMYNTDYVSEQQCFVDDFFDKDFSPCPIKCLPIQMRGFRYVNSSSDIKNCNKLEDEVCNGGPTVWKELDKHFKKCKKPCKISSYDHSLLEMREFIILKDNKNEASFEFVNSEVTLVEKEVLLYDFSDMIGTVGGSLGVGVGISVFAIISCCIDNFLELLNMFRTKTLFN